MRQATLIFVYDFKNYLNPLSNSYFGLHAILLIKYIIITNEVYNKS